MGLDLVELTIEVETIFGITIPDKDASTLITVGQLYDYILAKLPSYETNRCLSATTFYRFRRELMSRYEVSRLEIRPSTLIESIFPSPRRRSEWQRLGQDLDWQLPSLVRPTWMVISMFGMILGLDAAIIAAWGQISGFDPKDVQVVLAGMLFGSLLLLMLTFQLTRPFATRFSRDCRSVRGTILASLALNYGKNSSQGPGWNRREVWECLREIIVKQLGVAPEEVVQSAEFVKDFGAD